MRSPSQPEKPVTERGETRIVLIGGASHVGKSTLCDALGELPGWSKMSTDELGRHPGRPWPVPGRPFVREHVAAHYLSLSPEELLNDVLDYQRRMWPTIDRILSHVIADPTRGSLGFQGSALLPKNIAKFRSDRVKTLCLSGSPEFLEARIHTNSSYESLPPGNRELVDRFIQRNVLLNERYVESAKESGVQVIDVSTGITVTELMELAANPSDA